MRATAFVFCLTVFAAPAWAGFDHPDLVDVDATFSSTSPDPVSQNTAAIRQQGSVNQADGELQNNPASAFAEINWNLYEPDRVSRGSNGAKLSQGSYLQIGFSTWDTGDSTWNQTIVEKCKGSTSVSGSQGNVTDAKWKVSCKGALEALGVDETTAMRLEELLGGAVNARSDKINIKGRGVPQP